jgi:hypothetical protein
MTDTLVVTLSVVSGLGAGALAALVIQVKRRIQFAIRCWRVRQELRAVAREGFSELR